MPSNFLISRFALFWERLWQDTRQACRMFLKAPGFTAIAILSIACGTGANVAMFSVADALLLRPLPIPRPGELLTVGIRKPAVNGLFNQSELSYPDYLDLRAQNRSFEALTARLNRRAGISTAPNSPVHVRVVSLVAANFFDVMRVTPALGRGFVAGEDRPGGTSTVAVLSHEMWQRGYGSDPHVVGRTIRIAGIDFTIVGVTPDTFSGLDLVHFPDLVYVPLAMAPRLNDAEIAPLLTDRDARLLTVQGRLRKGVSLDRAQAEFRTLADGLAAVYPRKGDHAIDVETELGERFASHPLDLGLVALLTALSLGVLAVACANVAGLLASRAPLRAREISLKLAIGADRRRLVRQMVTESLMLAAAGGVCGLAVGRVGIAILRQMRYPIEYVSAPTLDLDLRALTFALLVATTSAFIFGLWPAIHTTRVGLAGAVREAEDRPTRWRLTPRAFLVAAQIALSLALVTAAAYSFQIFSGVSFQGPGFRTTNIAKITVDTADRRLSDDQAAAFFERTLARVRDLPGVTSATVTSGMPFWSAGFAAVQTEGAPPLDDAAPTPVAQDVDEAYFTTLDMPIVKGRGFLRTDDRGAAPVAIVNETLAKRRWPGRDPIGQRVQVSPSGTWIEVVGVARDAKYLLIVEPPQEAIYFPFRQHPTGSMVVLARTGGSSAALVDPLRRLMTDLDRDMPAYDAQTMEDYYEARAIGLTGAATQMIGGIGAMGTVLTLVGLYGLVSFSVARRTREIGIRMAIGATTRNVVSLFLRQGMQPAYAGLPVGLALSVLILRVAPSFVMTTDYLAPGFFVGVALGLAGLVVVAAFIPARRAARVNPMVALRYE